MWWREWIQAEKYSSWYYPGKFPQPSNIGQYSNAGNTENTTKIFHKKSNPKAHNHQIHQVEMKEKILRAAREKGRVTTKGSPSDSQQISWQKLYKPGESVGQYSTSLKKRTFNPEFHIQPNWAYKWRKNKIFANKQVLRDFVTTRPALQELLKEALHIERNNQYQPFQKHTKC